MRPIMLAACAVMSLAGIHGAAAADHPNPDGANAQLILVGGDGLDADAAATGNTRTGEMWRNATGYSRGPSFGWYGRPRSWAHYHRYRRPAWRYY